jgi:hypothetical protein
MREKGVLVRAAWAREMPVSSGASTVSNVATVPSQAFFRSLGVRVPSRAEAIPMGVSVSLSRLVREPRKKISFLRRLGPLRISGMLPVVAFSD